MVNIKKRVLGLWILFVLYTVAVSTIDVKSIGPNESEIGFSILNEFVRSRLIYNEFWYVVSDWLGLFPIAVALGYGVMGFIQLLKYRSFNKVDKSIICLGFCFISIVFVYILFEVFVVNYRPLLIDGFLEPSYPSSHVFVSISVILCVILTNERIDVSVLYKRIFKHLTLLILIVIVVGRVVSGVHWISDIIGGILLSAMIVSTYNYFLSKC